MDEEGAGACLDLLSEEEVEGETVAVVGGVVRVSIPELEVESTSKRSLVGVSNQAPIPKSPRQSSAGLISSLFSFPKRPNVEADEGPAAEEKTEWEEEEEEEEEEECWSSESTGVWRWRASRDSCKGSKEEEEEEEEEEEVCDGV